MPTEDTFVERLKRDVMSQCPSAFIFRPNDARASGVPDLFIFAAGECIVIEAKAPTSEPRDKAKAPWLQHDFSPLQVAFLKNIAAAGSQAFGAVYVISTGDAWLIPASKISVRMTFDYVKNNGLKMTNNWLEQLLCGMNP